MINVTDLRNGTTFLYYDAPYKVINYEHIKVSRGGATVKVKVMDLITGSIKDISFSSNNKVEEANVENVNMQFLYSDNEMLHFMNLADFSDVSLPLKDYKNEAKYLVEGKEFQVTLFEGKPIAIVLPASMFYKVVEAFDAVKGNTSNNPSKEVTLENGLVVMAPMFVKVGDILKINTTTGQYSSRAN